MTPHPYHHLFEEQIVRILAKWRRVRAKYPHGNVRFGPRATDEQIAVFEAQYGIQLPLDYRVWIQCVGDGIWDENCRENDDLIAFFSVNDPPPEYCADSGPYRGLVSFPVQWRDMGVVLSNGEFYMELECQGDGDLAKVLHYAPSNQYWLLVLSGPEKGRVWVCDDYGERQSAPAIDLKERPVSFLEWMERCVTFDWDNEAGFDT